MRSLSKWVRDWEVDALPHEFNTLATYMDMVWLDQRLEHLDYEQPFDFQDPAVSDLVTLILGEADSISHMVQTAPGRIPKATDIWHFNSYGLTATRRFVSRFTERPPEAETPATLRAQTSDSSTPAMPPYPATLTPQTLGLKRPASPSSSISASRRQRFEMKSTGVGSETGGEGSARSEAEDMEI
jgi:hypothetical protein